MHPRLPQMHPKETQEGKRRGCLVWRGGVGHCRFSLARPGPTPEVKRCSGSRAVSLVGSRLVKMFNTSERAGGAGPGVIVTRLTPAPHGTCR
jgi:hypothetical protein